MNWKTQTAAAIVTHAAPAAMPDSQQALANELAALIDGGKIAAGSLDFAKSVHGGYVKYGSFTPKQVDAVRNLIARTAGQAEPAPVAGPDVALAAALEAALPYVAAKDHGFALSLLGGFKRYGSFTEKQRPWAERFANCFPASIIENPAPAAPQQPQDRVTACYPATAALFAPDRFSRFSVGPVSLSRSNDGALVWIKFKGYQKVVGKMSLPTGTAALFPRLSDADHATLRDTLALIEQDPRAAAATDGIRTGRCSCCGRELTDPTSIAIGIGPICLERF